MASPAEKNQVGAKEAGKKASGDKSIPVNVASPINITVTGDVQLKSAAQQQERQDHAFYENPDWWMFVATLGLVLVTAGLVHVTKKLWSATKELVDRTIESTKVIERAYVKLSHNPPGVQFNDSAYGEFWVSIHLKNYGQTPATAIECVICHACLPSGEKLPAHPNYDVPTAQRSQLQAFLVRDDYAGYAYESRFPPQHLISVKNGSYKLWVYGYIEYVDMFQRRHVAGYGRMYDHRLDIEALYPEGEFPKRSNLVFVTEPNYNYDREK